MDKGNQPVYERYTEPGGEDYTELVFKTKTKDMTTPAILEGEFGTLANNKVKKLKKLLLILCLLISTDQMSLLM